MIIYLERLLPIVSSDPPWNESGKSMCSTIWSCFGWGLHGYCCYQQYGSLLHCLSTLTTFVAVYFCCTSLGVTSTGRYPASCPMKPGLSSPAFWQPRSFILLLYTLIKHQSSFHLQTLYK